MAHDLMMILRGGWWVGRDGRLVLRLLARLLLVGSPSLIYSPVCKCSGVVCGCNEGE